MFRVAVRRYRRVLRRRALKPSAARLAHYAANKEEARALICARVAELNVHYNFAYNRIAIRNTRSRWGSCSRKRNLNFSYIIASLPQGLRDYVIVHELCHLAAFNHSPAFWDRVAETLPNHRSLRASLRKHGHLLRA
ncbi:MAG: M48 family metallopeptidase [Patescibacteria group bacterium]